MKQKKFISFFILSVFCIFNLELFAEVKDVKPKLKELDWQTLSEFDINTKKVGKNLKPVLGKKVTLKGFMIPLDGTKEQINEFLLVPYIPSCMHVPPPPENQIIKVTTSKKEGIKVMMFPIEVTGKLTLEKSTKKAKTDQFIPEGVFGMDGASVKELKY